MNLRLRTYVCNHQPDAGGPRTARRNIPLDSPRRYFRIVAIRSMRFDQRRTGGFYEPCTGSVHFFGELTDFMSSVKLSRWSWRRRGPSSGACYGGHRSEESGAGTSRHDLGHQHRKTMSPWVRRSDTAALRSLFPFLRAGYELMLKRFENLCRDGAQLARPYFYRSSVPRCPSGPF